MANDAIDKKIAALRAVLVEDIESIRDAVKSSNSLLIAAAARLASERTLTGLQPELAAAFKRLLPGGVRSDKGCQAKTAICKTLNLLGWEDDEVFLAGVRHRQPEPSYGGPIDTAATLRAECAVGLARVASPHRLAELTRLLLDPESEARAGAANALGIVGNETAEMLLRLKILTGDPDARVFGECFRTLLAVAGHSGSGHSASGCSGSGRAGGESAIEFTLEFVANGELPIAEEAALALVDSKRPEAVPLLIDARKKMIGETARRTIVLSAIASTRSDASLQFVCDVIENDPLPAAETAITTAASYRSDRQWHESIQKATTRRNDPHLLTIFRSAFGG